MIIWSKQLGLTALNAEITSDIIQTQTMIIWSKQLGLTALNAEITSDIIQTQTNDYMEQTTGTYSTKR